MKMNRKNAFLAFGIPPEDATIDVLRSDLAAAIGRFLSDGQFSQKKAGEILGLPQGTVSDIVRGNIERLSIERLIRAMIRARIPGWAEWVSADSARAGRGYYPVVMAGVSRTERSSLQVDPTSFYLQPSDPLWEQWVSAARERQSFPNTYEIGFDENRKNS